MLPPRWLHGGCRMAVAALGQARGLRCMTADRPVQRRRREQHEVQRASSAQLAQRPHACGCTNKTAALIGWQMLQGAAAVAVCC